MVSVASEQAHDGPLELLLGGFVRDLVDIVSQVNGEMAPPPRAVARGAVETRDNCTGDGLAEEWHCRHCGECIAFCAVERVSHDGGRVGLTGGLEVARGELHRAEDLVGVNGHRCGQLSAVLAVAKAQDGWGASVDSVASDLGNHVLWRSEHRVS